MISMKKCLLTRELLHRLRPPVYYLKLAHSCRSHTRVHSDTQTLTLSSSTSAVFCGIMHEGENSKAGHQTLTARRLNRLSTQLQYHFSSFQRTNEDASCIKASLPPVSDQQTHFSHSSFDSFLSLPFFSPPNCYFCTASWNVKTG